jgi:hypothetical protein
VAVAANGCAQHWQDADRWCRIGFHERFLRGSFIADEAFMNSAPALRRSIALVKSADGDRITVSVSAEARSSAVRPLGRSRGVRSSLMGYAENDREGQVRLAAFREELQKLGWAEGRHDGITALLARI